MYNVIKDQERTFDEKKNSKRISKATGKVYQISYLCQV